VNAVKLKELNLLEGMAIYKAGTGSVLKLDTQRRRAALDLAVLQAKRLEAQLNDIAKLTSAEKQDPTLLYDGKTFNQWRRLWKNELKIGKRIECIEALAAFGRVGKGKEAAEAIMEVTKQYDFGSRMNKSVLNFHSAIVKALTGYDSIPERRWLSGSKTIRSSGTPWQTGFLRRFVITISMCWQL